MLSRDPLKLTLPTADGTRRDLVLSEVPATSTGHAIFHRQTASRLACASCHPEGGDDGRTWALPEGARRTPTLRGGLKGTEPFHWAGNLRDIDALMGEVMVGRMGDTGHSSERNQAVLDWLDTVPALPPPANFDPAAAERGRAVFESAAVGCASCHAGRQGTNNGFANVGTGQTLQVPRLTELGSRAPYFHDGRILRMEDRFAPEAGGDLHGNVSSLDAQQRSDLVAYLRSR
jgi:cytochrome c peroxidase